MLVSTSRTNVKMPRMISAGKTVATTGASRCVVWAKKPNAISALDTDVR